MGAGFEPGQKMLRILGRLASPQQALQSIGLLMLEESQAAFRKSGWNGAPWTKRKSPNVFGIIADFSTAGRSAPPKRRFQDGPPLRDTGAMEKSLAFRVVGATTVEAGAYAKYAGVHNRGGTVESLPITKLVQQKLARWLKRQPKTIRGQLGWLLNAKFTGKKLKMEVPERRMVGITKQTRANIREVIGVEIMETR